MRDQIVSHLAEIEQKRDIRILLAVESGSRAWGFPSPDSDYDIRIIFTHSRDSYLRVDNPADAFAHFEGELLDFSGWDLRKSLRLLRSSNATLFEWSKSPIIYHSDSDFLTEFRQLCKAFFQPQKALYHYRGIAKKSFLTLEDNLEIKVKKLFYVIRPLLAAHWILDFGGIPPMDIQALMRNPGIETIKGKLEKLIELKKDSREGEMITLKGDMVEFIDSSFQRLEVEPESESHELPSSMVLDNFFRDQLTRYQK